MSARRGRGGGRRRRLSLAAATVLAIAFLAGCAKSDFGAIFQTASATGGDIEHGGKIFRKCVICHSLEKNGRNKVGPRLHGLFGRVSGSVSDYKYSRALKAAQIVWNADSLDIFFSSTTTMVPGTKMYADMSRGRDRADLIAFLKKATGGIKEIAPNYRQAVCYGSLFRSGICRARKAFR